jgi:hypothetical protein
MSFIPEKNGHKEIQAHEKDLIAQSDEKKRLIEELQTHQIELGVTQ